MYFLLLSNTRSACQGCCDQRAAEGEKAQQLKQSRVTVCRGLPGMSQTGRHSCSLQFVTQQVCDMYYAPHAHRVLSRLWGQQEGQAHLLYLCHCPRWPAALSSGRKSCVLSKSTQLRQLRVQHRAEARFLRFASSSIRQVSVREGKTKSDRRKTSRKDQMDREEE